MPWQIDEAEEAKAAEEYAQQQALYVSEKQKAREHELQLLKLRIQLEGKQKQSVSRIEAVQRVLIAIVKAPTIPFVLFVIGHYVRQGREVPASIEQYLNL